MTPDPNGWPDPEAPGYPQNPRDTGYHWLRVNNPLKTGSMVGVFVAQWHALDRRWWAAHNWRGEPRSVADGYTYLGPVLTPEQHKELLEQAEDHLQHNAELQAELAALRPSPGSQSVTLPRALVEEAIDDIMAYVKHQYAGTEGYPTMKARMERDMAVADALRRAMEGSAPTKVCGDSACAEGCWVERSYGRHCGRLPGEPCRDGL